MSMHYDSESLVDRGRSPRLFALLVMIQNQKATSYYENVLLEIKNFG